MLVLLISLLVGEIEGTYCYALGYVSNRLEKISTHMGLQQCDSSFTVKYGGRDIVVRVADGYVEHIGFRIFSEDVRASVLFEPVADFVERYWLELTLPMRRDKSVAQQMREDRFRFEKGNISSIDMLQANPGVELIYNVLQDRISIAWGEICQISFPINHELILGRGMIENDSRLPDDISHANIGVRSEIVLDSETYLSEYLSSKRYFAPDGSPIFDAKRIAESITNLFTDYDIETADSIRLDITHKTFGLAEQKIETTVRQFVAYAIQSGCRPYVGIISSDELKSDLLVMFHNRHLSYNHVLRASVPNESIIYGSGCVTARLNAFVPSSNIKNLFKD